MQKIQKIGMDCSSYSKCLLKHNTKLKAQELFLGWSRVPRIQDYTIEIF